MNLTIDRLRELLEYDPARGIFVRRVGVKGHPAGVRAGSAHAQRRARHITIDKKKYLEHRLAWFYVHGQWPENEIDHKNRAGQDNRISNLRPATSMQNKRNSGRRSDNTSGFKGVGRYKTGLGKRSTRWRARIKINGSERYLGTFDTPQEAHAAYAAAARALFRDFASP